MREAPRTGGERAEAGFHHGMMRIRAVRPAAPLPIKANGAISVREFLLAVAPFPADNEEGFITIHWNTRGGKGFPEKPFEPWKRRLLRLSGYETRVVTSILAFSGPA